MEVVPVMEHGDRINLVKNSLDSDSGDTSRNRHSSSAQIMKVGALSKFATKSPSSVFAQRIYLILERS